MILIKNLKTSYKKNEYILDDLNLKLNEKLIHGIVGLNGSGKTTLLNSVFGLKKNDSGKILYKDEKISKINIAYLPTENYFFPHITGKEYLDLFKNSKFNTDKWNKLFNLPLNKIIDTYSTGMKKKLAFFGILKKDKPIIILDEPFNGIDIETVRIIRSILLKLKEKGKTIIITSHIIETLLNLCDFIHYLEGKKIKYNIPKDEFDKFENEIFNSIEEKNKDIINDLIKQITSQI